jgi:hypothetical protein
MTENGSEKRGEFHFVQLVIMFQAAAMQQMGKVQNPITKKVERNLDQARFSIDILEMIQNKTTNNLSDNERKFLEQTLYELRMNYLDEVKKAKQPEEEIDSAQTEEGKDQSRSGDSTAEKEEQAKEDTRSARQDEEKDQSASDDLKEKKN